MTRPLVFLALAALTLPITSSHALGGRAGPGAETRVVSDESPPRWPPGVWSLDDVPTGLAAAVVDSARGELRVGRAWHATRLLRGAGAADARPSDVLLLASAEAAWKNHDAVVDLLADAPWIERQADGQGYAYLGHALEALERWDRAADAYEAYLETPAAERDPMAPAAAVRRARALAKSGDHPAALAALDAVADDAEVARSWAAVEAVEGSVAESDTALVAAYAERITDEGARGEVWQRMARARLAAGDRVAALEEFRRLRETETGARRALAGVEIGALLLQRGDTAEAVAIMRESIDDAVARTAGRAAAVVLAHGSPDAEESLRLARVLDRAGDGGPALRAFDRAARLSGGAEALPDGDRLSRARLMATVRSRQDDAVEEFRALTDTLADTEERVAARTLEVWAGLRSRQGQTGNVNLLRQWLLERYPGSAEAAELLWDRGWEAETDGATDRAVETYERILAHAPSHARGGQAAMRLGQIHLGRGDAASAARVYEAYLDAFPDGRRWEEAAFWAAKARLDLGDEAAARRHLARLEADEPFSYYAVMGAGILAEEYRMVPLAAADSVVEPGWLLDGFRRMDLLDAAGLEDGVDGEADRLLARARGDAPVMLRLAEGLNQRGHTIRGINIGWELRREGHGWDDRLVRVIYPFPYREMVEREAAERGVDPILMAALIRQESAWVEDIVSSAGALGLMQVMPATGRELAGRHGPEGFTPEALTTAEVNLHLGSAFLLDMTRRYGDLPLVLSAYNAGPTRATRWRNYPEAGDWLRFTERVPFEETRGYIKNVSRNLGVYRILYGPLM